MKNTLKLFFVIVLFCSTVFADGSMGNGKTCPPNTTCLVNTPTVETMNETDSENSMIKFFQNYLISIFG